ncbi:MAG: class I SAM-dependent methyltransferase [Acidobacteriia bacterium]|nr:class I SAM-dependent methyltransferase [Terriglobia bacterium]
MKSDTLPAWATELAEVGPGDERLESRLPGMNVPLNRARLASFLCEFGEDRDVRDFLALDLLGTTAGLPLSSTGAAETIPSLVFRPFRLWEYVWIYKGLGLSKGGQKVLDLGGPGTHLSILTAMAGSSVTSVDINAEFVQAAQDCARTLKLGSLGAVVGDMRDLSRFPEASFDAVMSCSVLEHLAASDQELALREMARVLKPGGLVGLTFDYGEGAPGANEYLPPPHDPPPNAAAAVRRYSQGGLVVVGNEFSEDPVPGCLFRDAVARYTVASLFLAKPPAPVIQTPRREEAGSVLGGLVMEGLPFRVHGGSSRIRDMQHQSRRVPLLENGLAATETALAGEQRRAAMLEEGLASTEANRGWLLGLVQKYEAEGWIDFFLRWMGRLRRRLKGSAS